MPDSANSSTNIRRVWLIVLALALAHLCLALWFASVTPYRTAGRILGQPAPDIGAPDERAHANYIQELLDGHGIPKLDVDRMSTDKLYRAEQYESHQPPLYYIAAFCWCKVVGVSDVDDPAAGVRLRSLNALFGGATVLGVFFAAYWGFKRADLALGAALFPAFLPMNVALSGAVSNDPLLFALMAWTMALVARALRDGWKLKLAIGAGLLTGLAIVTKTSGVALLPVLLVATLIPQAKRPNVAQLVAAILGLVVVAGPWLARNQAVYHDPLATNVFHRAFDDTSHKEMIQRDPSGKGFLYWTNWVGWWTARSFVGVFGYADIFLNERGTSRTEPGVAPNTLYRVTLGVLAFLALGWLRSLGEPWAKDARAVTIANATLIIVVLLLFLRFDNVFFQAQARYLFPALGPIAVGFGSGIVTWARKRPAIGLALTAVGLVSLVIYSGVRLPDEFAKRSMPVGLSNGGIGSSVQ